MKRSAQNNVTPGAKAAVIVRDKVPMASLAELEFIEHTPLLRTIAYHGCRVVFGVGQPSALETLLPVSATLC